MNKDHAKVYKNNNKANLYYSLLYCVTCACMERLKRIDLGCVTRYYPPNTLPTKNGVYSTLSDYDGFGLGTLVVGLQYGLSARPTTWCVAHWPNRPHRSPGFSITSRRPVSVSLSPRPLVAKRRQSVERYPWPGRTKVRVSVTSPRCPFRKARACEGLLPLHRRHRAAAATRSHAIIAQTPILSPISDPLTNDCR